MAFDLASISTESVLRAPRIILLGVEKIGKTTFACGSRVKSGRVVEYGLNSPIVVSVKGEEGADSIPVAKFPIAPSFNAVMDAIGTLYTEDHEYSTLVIDSASTLEPLLWDRLCAENDVKSIEKVGGGYGKGYTEALSYWRNLLDGLDALRNTKNMASIIIGHVKVKRFDDPAGDSYDTYMFDVHEKASNMLFRWADLILFANTKVIVKKEDTGFGAEKKRGVEAAGGQRFLYTQKRPAHPGGGRGLYGMLPYELPFDWASFEDAVQGLTAKPTKGEQK